MNAWLVIGGVILLFGVLLVLTLVKQSETKGALKERDDARKEEAEDAKKRLKEFLSPRKRGRELVAAWNKLRDKEK